MTTTVEEHYTQPDLLSAITGALARTEKDLDRLTPEDLAPVDEFHLGGRAATEELFDLAEFKPGMNILDVGSGIGGPARTLASTRGCRVTGIDLTEDFCRVARTLTKLVGLSSKVRFRNGNALAMPFEDRSFDAVLLQHATMNIADKKQLYREIRRVLRPEGRLVLYEITAGPRGPVYLPVPWASEPPHNHLIAPEELRTLLEVEGWMFDHWEEVTESSRLWARTLLARVESEGPPPLGLHLILGPTAREKITNVVANLQDGRIRVVRGILRPAPDT